MLSQHTFLEKLGLSCYKFTLTMLLKQCLEKLWSSWCRFTLAMPCLSLIMTHTQSLKSNSGNEISRGGQSLLTLEKCEGCGNSNSHKMATRGDQTYQRQC